MSWGDWGFIDTPEVRWRLAMAWEDWKDKIHRQNADGYPDEDFCGGGDCSSFDWRHDGRDMRYQIDHEDGAWSALDYGHYADSQNKPYVAVHMIRTHPGYRKDGIAEALMRRLVDDHPGVRVDPGDMTQEGQAFHDRMLQKEPRAKALVTAANRIIQSMAWEDWKDKIQGGCKDGCISPLHTHGRYILPEAGAFLNYSHRANNLFISDIYTHPQNRNDGVAEALMRRLTEDHPGVPIDPGYMTPDGQKFHDRMLEKDPSARDLVTAATSILRALEESEI